MFLIALFNCLARVNGDKPHTDCHVHMRGTTFRHILKITTVLLLITCSSTDYSQRKLLGNIPRYKVRVDTRLKKLGEARELSYYFCAEFLVVTN